VIQNLKTGLQCDLFFHFIQALQVRVDDFFAVDANNVRVGIGFVSVIPVAPVREPQLENLAQRLYQHDISVYGRKAHGRKIFGDLGVDVLDAGVAVTFGKRGNDGQSLGCDLVTMVSQLLDDNLGSFSMVRQHTPLYF
jgi:hypothetical protein